MHSIWLEVKKHMILTIFFYFFKRDSLEIILWPKNTLDSKNFRNSLRYTGLFSYISCF